MGIAGRTHQTPTDAAATNIPRRVGADNVLNIDRSPDMINTISRAWDRAAAPTSTVTKSLAPRTRAIDLSKRRGETPVCGCERP